MQDVMSHEQARELGHTHGHDMATFAVMDYPDASASEIEEKCLDNQEHFRQYSPFEFYAAAMNRNDDAEGVWEEYDIGFLAGIKDCLAKYERV